MSGLELITSVRAGFYVFKDAWLPADTGLSRADIIKDTDGFKLVVVDNLTKKINFYHEITSSSHLKLISPTFGQIQGPTQLFGFNFAFAEEANELADKIKELGGGGGEGKEPQDPFYPNNDEGYYHETDEQVHPEEQQDPQPPQEEIKEIPSEQKVVTEPEVPKEVPKEKETPQTEQEEKQPPPQRSLPTSPQPKREFIPKTFSRKTLPANLEKFRTEFMNDFVAYTNEVKNELIKSLQNHLLKK